MIGILTLLLACFFILPPLSVQSPIAYDCSESFENFVLLYSAYPKCESKPNYETLFVQIVELKGRPTITGYGCKATYNQTISDISGNSRPGSNGTEDIDRKTCLKAHETKSITLGGSRIPFIDTNGTIYHTVSPDHHVVEGNDTANRNPQYQYTRTYEVTLFETVGTADLPTNLIWFDNNVVCDYDNLGCGDDQYGHIYWKEINIDKESYPLSEVLYQGSIQLFERNGSIVSNKGYYVVVPDVDRDHIAATQQNAMVLKAYNLTSTDFKVFRTDILNVFISVKDNLQYPYSYPPIPLTQYAFRILIGNGTYFEAAYGTIAHPIFLVKDSCENERKTLYLRLRLLKDGDQLSLPVKGFTVSKRRSVLGLSRCMKRNVIVRETRPSFCEIPVTFEGGNVTKYLDTISRIVYDRPRRPLCGSDSTSTQMADENAQNTSKEILAIVSPSQSAHVDYFIAVLIAIFCISAVLVVILGFRLMFRNNSTTSKLRRIVFHINSEADEVTIT